LQVDLHDAYTCVLQQWLAFVGLTMPTKLFLCRVHCNGTWRGARTEEECIFTPDKVATTSKGMELVTSVTKAAGKHAVLVLSCVTSHEGTSKGAALLLHTHRHKRTAAVATDVNSKCQRQRSLTIHCQHSNHHNAPCSFISLQRETEEKARQPETKLSAIAQTRHM
jgi:hypothetical protein